MPNAINPRTVLIKVDPESERLYVRCKSPEQARALLCPQTDRGRNKQKRLAKKALEFGAQTVEVYVGKIYQGSFSSRLFS